MSDRLKIFGAVALLGFLAGVVVQLSVDYVIPWLILVVPALVHISYLISGFAGACLTLVLVSIWAYMNPSER
jgi:hypothetical protein